ncbi:uncharacterized protein MONBRDRAFT_27078 [Monosiga brevicollis MX1]|uniref:THUMP domain-containing protein n=1 Tax=Monosiga brevicollis TaxID=81824 RepID=A9V488_MONBE|nr:uncharacterized protein MONBRDRAFT_27078 [Monosiga brevicollis MX1]EDQ87664.1 predicted protein [Monosiga brevicollis MX1]|eukprot:XP_001747584.1 hypothetical protein [Monosiga brevicollis MX1]
MPPPPASGSAKRRKNQYVGNGKRGKYAGLALKPNLQGCLITCSPMHEGKALADARNLLAELIDSATAAEAASSSTTADSDTLTVEDELKAELDALQASRRPDGKPSGPAASLQQMHIDVKGVMFLALEQDPTPLVIKIAEQCRTTGVAPSRVIERLLPVQRTCEASIEAISACLKSLLPNTPLAVGQPPTTYAIDLKRRFNQKLDRDALIHALAAIEELQPHKADLTTPSVTVVIELIKHVAGVSILAGYRSTFRRYNLREIVKASFPDQPAKQQEPEAPIAADEDAS